MSNKIKKAIISLSDKSEIKLLLNALKKYKVNIISSGGTSKAVSYTHLTLPTTVSV